MSVFSFHTLHVIVSFTVGNVVPLSSCARHDERMLPYGDLINIIIVSWLLSGVDTYHFTGIRAYRKPVENPDYVRRLFQRVYGSSDI